MAKVGVTGGQGFIGKWVTAELVDRGHEVVVLDHKKVEHPEFTGLDQVEYLWGSVTDDVDMMELAAQTDGIIHLAAVLESLDVVDPRPRVQANVMAGLNFLEAISRYDKPGVHICDPLSISKTTVEKFSHQYREHRSTQVNQVRAVNVYGPRQSVAPPFSLGGVFRIVPVLICQALSGRPLEATEKALDVVYAGDLAMTVVEAWEHAAEGGIYHKVVECGSGSAHTMMDVAEAVADAASSLGHDRVSVECQPSDIPTPTTDPETLRLLGISPEKFIPLDVGILKTMEWFGNNEDITWRRPS